jgi:hypothetical protein
MSEISRRYTKKAKVTAVDLPCETAKNVVGLMLSTVYLIAKKKRKTKERAFLKTLFPPAEVNYM